MNGSEWSRAAKMVVEAYCNVTEHKTPEEYLQGLTESLDELCVLSKREPPVIEGVFR